ncbi:ABC transporter substrate-binding protein [Paenibacillus yanchengensis]|uniref:ABC transporter substrate-binding protein n=1 Tax=Paenibacillus yanchengensis TaxID=2035833 RepID=A0ABW4YK76_9BACL
MKNGLLKYVNQVIFVILCIGLLTGCTTTQSKEKKVITILYSSTTDFKMDYGNTLQAKFKNIDFQIIEYSPILGDGIWNGLNYVPTSGDDWDAARFIALVKEKNPDIIYFPTAIYPSLLEENLLKDVTDYASQYDFSEIDTPIMENLQIMGEGRLYFLSDSLASQAIYYNKDLFANYNISAPNDFMTWDDILTLANYITERGIEDGVTGLLTPYYDMVDLFLLYGKSNGLTWYNPNDVGTSFNHDAWKSVLEVIIEKNKWESNLPATEKRYTELFQDNKVAMVLDSYLFKDELARSDSKIDWGLATAPVLNNETDKSYSVTFQYLNGINNATPHSKEVLEVWAHLNGKDVARKRHNMSLFRYTIPVRSNLLRDDEMRNIAVFYKLTSPMSLLSMENNLPRQTESEVKRYLYSQMQDIIANHVTIADAVSNWDVEIPSIIQVKSD